MSQPSAGDVPRQVSAQLKWILNDNLSASLELLAETTNIERIQPGRRPLAGLNDLFFNWRAHKWTDDLTGEWETHVESEELQK